MEKNIPLKLYSKDLNPSEYCGLKIVDLNLLNYAKRNLLYLWLFLCVVFKLYPDSSYGAFTIY